VLKDIVEARPIGGHRVYLRFEDGLEGEVDIGAMIEFTGVFAALGNEAEFAKLRVDRETGTIAWPGGADLDPDVLYAAISGKPFTVDTAGEGGS
jgi:hypothetical protein